VSSDWVRKSYRQFQINVTIPANGAAEVFVRLLDLKPGGATVRESNTVVFDKGNAIPSTYVTYLEKRDGCLAFRVGSGGYEFTLTPH